MSTLTNTYDAAIEYGVTADAIGDMTGVRTASDRYRQFRSQWNNEPDADYFEPDIIGALSDEAYNLGTYETRAQARAVMGG